jgi:5-methylcytosine-specific restriction enzyme B
LSEIEKDLRSWLNQMMAQLTSAEINSAMDDCARQGLDAFLGVGGFGQPSKDWVRRSSESVDYPAKAIVAAALGKLEGGRLLRQNEFYKGYGEPQARRRLMELGFEVIEKKAGDREVPGSENTVRPFDRLAVETAMDVFENYRQKGDHAALFKTFGEARDYWVRSSRQRVNRVYPSKPIVGHLLNKLGDALNGGWGQKADAAARLHNSGFIIVDQDDNPVPPPERYDHLIRDADRIRLCALNYFIEPARERDAPEAAIRASEIAKAMGLQDAFPNICGALGGEKFQQLAQVPPPTHTEPNPSSSTIFTYKLASRAEAATVTEATTTPTRSATNLIFYGPPGTGKTYATAMEAVRLCGEPVPEDREELMAAYRRLSDAGRIEFVTFHQSISYEDFVEGLRPTQASEEGAAGFELKSEQGVFRRIARRAETSTGPGDARFSVSGRQIFKMSIGEAANPEDAHLFEEAITGGYTLLGFEDIDWSDDRFSDRSNIIEAVRSQGVTEGGEPNAMSGRVQMPFIFRNWMKSGDIVVVSKGNSLFRAIGQVRGGYQFVPRDDGGYSHRRAVRWLWVDRAGVPASEIYARNFTQKSIYLLTDAELNLPALERYIASQQNSGTGAPEPFVLIIDEINRANISKVFGELITLLEPDKRIGQPNALKVRLPYSGDVFGVPANLHVIGTMNTADRSIALLDTALRRRFEFRELMPDASRLSTVDGIDLALLLATINERIEYLFDREHQIGHAYFIRCESRADIDDVMRHKVIPLLAEYFYEDWAKVAVALGDGHDGEGDREGRFIDRRRLKPPKGMGNDEEAAPRHRWNVRDAFSYDDFSAG